MSFVRRMGFSGESRSRPRSERSGFILVEEERGEGGGARKMVFSTLARAVVRRRNRGLRNRSMVFWVTVEQSASWFFATVLQMVSSC